MSGRAKVAPVLSAIAEETIQRIYGDEEGERAGSELRALLSVARAADAALRPGGQWIKATGGSELALLRFQRAWARLSRASAPGRKRT